MYSHDIRSLRKAISKYLSYKDSVWILFDNLDKGWSAHGLVRGDILIVRCLIDASRKIQRELQKEDRELHCVVFIRNDVYQFLMDQSPDFGKESRATLDWSDPDQLREMLRLRLIQNEMPRDALTCSPESGS